MKQQFVKVAIFVSCLAVTSCGSAPTAPKEAEYSVINISTTDKEVQSMYSATIRGRQDVDIYPQVSGTISQLCVNEGQVVSKGQTLFIIDQVPYKAALQTAQANVDAANAGVATVQLTYDSKKELFSKNVISQYELSVAENSLLTSKAQLAQAEAQRVNAANNLSYTVVKSPSNGVVGTLPYRVGALVGPSVPQPLTTVSDNSDLYVYFSMAENQLLDMTREYGSMVNAIKSMPKIQLKLNDGSIYSEQGTIESISGVIDSKTGSVSMRAVFPNKGHLLHSGSSGNVIIPIYRKECIVIPKVATFELQDKIYVYTIVDGKATSINVNVAKISNGNEYIVESGLNPGDIIVGEGVGLLREGTPIKVQNDAVQQADATVQDSTTVAATKIEKQK